MRPCATWQAMAFPWKLRDDVGVTMEEKKQHAAALRKAMSAQRADQRTVAAAVNRSKRTVGNWTSETKPTVPTEAERVILRRLLGPYDTAGDAVEVALAMSELTEDRRYLVLSTYKRLLREQAVEEAG